MIYLLIFIAVVFAGLGLFLVNRGQEELLIDVQNRSRLVVSKRAPNSTTLSTTIPLKNIGKQSMIIFDAFPRVLLPTEQFNLLTYDATLCTVPRSDHYFEAAVIEHKAELNVTLNITFFGDLNQMKNIPDFYTLIHVQFVGRKPLRFQSARLFFENNEICEACHVA